MPDNPEPDRAFSRSAMSAEFLDAETERALARAWRDERDDVALHRLVTAHLRLAISMASKYRRYGASRGDLIQEASIGLLRAAEKFDPDRGVRFSTYAIWWIKAQIQDFVMRDWSLVRTGSTSAQKRLFFGMRRAEARIALENGAETLGAAERRERVAADLNVPLRDVEAMEGRMSGPDYSLHAPQAGGDGRDWLETLEDDTAPTEETVGREHDLARARDWIVDAIGALTPREREILIARKVVDDPETLESLGTRYALSKERIRQLEVQALRKLRNSLEDRHGTAVGELAAAL